MQLISVNIGRAQTIRLGRQTELTGIFKEPGADSVTITAAGLAGDTVVDKENHSGPDQAVYVYGSPDYAWWSAELGADLEPGTFGENLTISGLESGRFAVGDRLRIGEVILEVTAPRIPCSKLAARMADPGFVKRFRQAERPGLYCRVIQPGQVRTGIAVTHEPHPGPTVTVLEMFRDFYEPQLSPDTLRRYLAAPIAIRAREHMESQLQARLAAAQSQTM